MGICGISREIAGKSGKVVIMIAGFPGKLRENAGKCGESREIVGNGKLRETGNCGKSREIAGYEKREIVGIEAGNCGKVCGNSRKFPQVGSTFFLWNVTYKRGLVNVLTSAKQCFFMILLHNH